MKNFDSNFKIIIQKFFFQPAVAGLYGFAIYFFVLLLVKTLRMFFGINGAFTVDTNDVSLASIGFLLVFLIRFLQNIKTFQKHRIFTRNLNDFRAVIRSALRG